MSFAVGSRTSTSCHSINSSPCSIPRPDSERQVHLKLCSEYTISQLPTPHRSRSIYSHPGWNIGHFSEPGRSRELQHQVKWDQSRLAAARHADLGLAASRTGHGMTAGSPKLPVVPGPALVSPQVQRSGAKFPEADARQGRAASRDAAGCTGGGGAQIATFAKSADLVP